MSIPQIIFPSMLEASNGFDTTEPSAWATYQHDFPCCGKLPAIEGEEINGLTGDREAVEGRGDNRVNRSSKSVAE